MICSRDDSLLLLRDLAIGTFQLLSQSEVRAVGVNRHFHFQMPSEAAWHAVGHRLAPKEPWTGLLESPGMVTVHMKGIRSDGRKGAVNVVVQPSMTVKLGVYVQVNDHYDLMKEKKPGCGSDVVNIVKTVWQESLDRSEKIAKTIVSV
jgi:hypothetical protein